MSLSKEKEKVFAQILKEELVPALGCTEPIAIAYAAAKARAVLGTSPEKVEIHSSGNIIKNVKGVTVPNTDGRRGIEIAAAAGVVGGDPDKKLEVLTTVTPEDIKEAEAQIKKGIYTASLLESPEKLHIIVKAFAGGDSALVEIAGSHTNIIRIEKNGEVLLEQDHAVTSEEEGADRTLLTVKDIITYAKTVDLTEVEDLILEQIRCNTAISKEGLKNSYGVNLGKLLLQRGDDTATKAKATAAAGSDARMSGSTLPVVINSGSGNQGITVSLPVIAYGEVLGSTQEELIRALLVSNLVSIHIKTGIGSLSAFCGAVSAAAGSGAGIAFLHGEEDQVIMDTISNTLAISSGIVCDGAKPSCAGKIASAVDSALLSYQMAKEGKAFGAGEGIVKEDIEGTIQAVGELAAKGMEQTDLELLRIMLKD